MKKKCFVIFFPQARSQLTFNMRITMVEQVRKADTEYRNQINDFFLVRHSGFNQKSKRRGKGGFCVNKFVLLLKLKKN